MKNILIILLILTIGKSAFAQDYTFSNHNIVPFSLNPALAGNAYAPRLALNYRQQWPSLGNRYHTVRLSYDQNFYKRICSFGAFYTMDDMANGSVRTNELGACYSHSIRIKDGHIIRLGLQASAFYNHYGDNFEFGDQYDNGSGKVLPNSSETISGDEYAFFADFATGAAYVFENHLTLGVAAYHITNPQHGIIDRDQEKLDTKITAHANFVQNLSNGNGLFGRQVLSERYFFANLAYQTQKDFDQIYGGLGLFLSPIIFGFSAKSDLDDVIIYSPMVGLSYKNFQAYYVFDFFTGDKQNGSWSHEISLIYIFHKNEKYPCPVVYW